MAFLNKLLSWAGFACIAVVTLISPWFFAAWEMWYFWPFVALIFAAMFFFSTRLLICSVTGRLLAEGWRVEAAGMNVDASRVRRNTVRKTILAISFGIFLAYAFVRFLQADVFMDAERSFLLLATPVLLGIQILFGFDRKQLRFLYSLVLANILLLGLYGIINHLGWKSTHVLWRPGYPQYIAEVRATGTYFCPDHFAGLMELGLCLALGIILARGCGRAWKILGVIVAVTGILGILLSKSRGGGLTVVVIGAAVLAVGFSQWPVVARWSWRSLVAGFAGLALLLFCHFETNYMNRFKEHFGWDSAHGKPVKEIVSIVKRSLVSSCRGQMYAAALRAWREKPVFGVGPGMHQNLWPHYAPSPDGNRELGVWPAYPNNNFHSYEVHNDWLQLLEEYGIVGLLLFLLPFGAVLGVLSAGVRREVIERKRMDWHGTGNDHYAMIIGAILACTAMAFHSLGDFNLQMPATVWLMAVILAVPMAFILNNEFNSNQ